MFLSMNWIQDFVDLSGLDLVKLINQFSLSTAEVQTFRVLLSQKSNLLKIIPIPKNFTS